MAWWRRKSKRTSAEDIRFLYLLCLGQEAHRESDYRARAGKSLHGIMSALLGSKTFQDQVLSVAATEENLPHQHLTPEQTKVVIEGLRRHTRLRVSQPFDGNWFALLSSCLDEDRFYKAARVHNSAAILQTFKERLNFLAALGPSALEGAIDEVNGMICRGWALDHDDLDRSLQLHFTVNGQFLGSCTTDRLRRDLQETYGGNGAYGFEHRLVLPDAVKNSHRLVLRVTDAYSGRPICAAREIIGDGSAVLSLMQRGSALMKSDDRAEQLEGLKDALPELDQYRAYPYENYALYANSIDIPAPQPKIVSDIHFAVIIFGDEEDTEERSASVASVNNQTYAGQVSLLEALSGDELAATAAGAHGDFLIFLQAGDQLHPKALDWFACTIDDKSASKLFYCDHDSASGKRHYRDKPVLKHCFDYDFLLAATYIGGTYCVRSEAFHTLKMAEWVSPRAFHLELQLRLYEQYGPAAFAQISHVLWHIAGDRRANTYPAHVIEAHFDRLGIDACLAPVTSKIDPVPNSGPYSGPDSGLRVAWPLAVSAPKLAIIIPTRDNLALIKPCVESLRATIEHKDATEIIIVDNGSRDSQTLEWLSVFAQQDHCRLIRDDSAFNWSALNNRAAAVSDADYFLFLNDDTLALEKGWDTVLRRHLNRKEIGVVGARLLYGDGSIQHAGVILYDTSVAVHEAAGQHISTSHYLNRSRLAHGCSAVTGAFLACRRDAFEQLGGFNETDLKVIFNDIDFCLRMREQGLGVLYEPNIIFHHLESKTRGYDHQDTAKADRAAKESRWMQAVWGQKLGDDPYYPKAFARNGLPFSRLDRFAQFYPPLHK